MVYYQPSDMEHKPEVTLAACAEEVFLDMDKIHMVNALVTIRCLDQNHTPTPMMPASHFIIALDTSGSMMGSKLSAMKSCILYFLNSLAPTLPHPMVYHGKTANGSGEPAQSITAPTCHVSLIQFASQVNLLTPTPVKADHDGIRLLAERVNGLTTSGCTNITGAIERALSITCASEPTHIILITDGQHNEGPSWDSLFSKDLSVAAIHTFSIGPEPEAIQLIRVSGRSSGGHYSHMQSIDQEHLSLEKGVFGAFINVLKTQIYCDCTLKITAMKGTRILNITGVSCANEVQTASKKYIYHIGSLCAGYKKLFLCELSVNRTDTRGQQTLIKAALRSRDGGNDRPSLAVSTTVSVERRDGDTQLSPRPSGELLVLRLEIYEAKQYSLMLSTIEQAMNYAETKQFSAAYDIINNTIRWFEAGGPSKRSTIQMYINELCNIRDSFATDESFACNRNKNYAVMASHAYQYGDVYTTE
jgi:Mg-chelatase subunit ChlD